MNTFKPTLFTCVDCGKETNKVVTRKWQNHCFECEEKRCEEILKKYGITGISNENPFNPEENYDYVFGIE